jgi:DNA-binding winged helix-turn-helix (wHTH) protein/TolB-like protein
MRLVRYQFGEYELDPASRELSRRGERIALPPKSFECLAYLVAHRDRAVGRDELILRGLGTCRSQRHVVAQTLLRARKALGDAGDRQEIVRTVPRFGYRWVAPVRELDPSMPASGAGSRSARVHSDPDLPATPVPARRSPAPWPSRCCCLSWRASLRLAVVEARTGRAAHDVASAAGDAVLVLPVVVTPSENENAWVRLGAMDYVASRLRRSGLKVVPSEQTLHLGAQLGNPATLDAAAWRKLQVDGDARWVIAPEARRDANGWRVRFNLREDGQPRVVEARGATPLSAAAAATDAWLQRVGRRSADSEKTPSPLTERVQRIDAELFVGQLAAARRLIDATPRAQRDDPRVRLREGQLEFRAGRVEQAARLFDTLLARRPPVEASLRAEA